MRNETADRVARIIDRWYFCGKREDHSAAKIRLLRVLVADYSAPGGRFFKRGEIFEIPRAGRASIPVSLERN